MTGYTQAIRRSRMLMALAGTLIVTACNPEEMVCTASISPAVQVEVRDAVTGEPIARGTTGTIRSGDYVAELLLSPASGDLRLYAMGDPGFYLVSLQRPGYRDWKRVVRVQHMGGACAHQVRGVVLRLSLERE